MIIGDRQYQQIGPEIISDMSSRQCIAYDHAYFMRYKQRCHTAIGFRLHRWRRSLVEAFSPPERGGRILDYGCGYGELVMRDTTNRWRGYDVIPDVRKRLGAALFDAAPDFADYVTICMFDVLEHIPEPLQLLEQIVPATLLVATVPCWEHWDDMESLPQWRHYRPGEHLLYTSKAGLIAFMRAADFQCAAATDYETRMGRQDVVTFIFRKMAPAASQ